MRMMRVVTIVINNKPKESRYPKKKKKIQKKSHFAEMDTKSSKSKEKKNKEKKKKRPNPNEHTT